MKEGIVRAQEMRSGHSGLYRVCLHAEQGTILIPKICIRNYECGHCSFDQWIDEMHVDMKANESQRFF
ncbi:hypothetical protein ACFL7M_13900 [Thermodesulfobacteriota bacterium]